MGEMWGRYGETWYELRVPHPGLEMWGDMGEMRRRYEEIWGDLRSVCRIQASRYGEILGGDEAAPRPRADDVDRDLCLAAVHAPAWVIRLSYASSGQEHGLVQSIQEHRVEHEGYCCSARIGVRGLRLQRGARAG